MKKVLSVFLSAVMVISLISMTVTAASDTCIRLTDTSGSKGYSAGSDAVNAYAVKNDGVTLIFDVLVESVATPGSGKFSQIVAFSGADPYNYAGYNFTKGAFTAGSGTEWVTSSQSNTFTAYSSKNFDWKLNKWYELAYQFDGDEVTVYLDGIPMVSAEVDSSFDTEYVILYPQYCTLLIDNLRVCGKDYNVRDRYGDVYAATNFTGITSISAVSDWLFSGDGGYSVASSGRAMPELGEMLPSRTVSPEISGAYLKYAEASGTGTVSTVANFATYNGFTVVEDIRIDRKSTALSNFSVRFGGNYIAGYDFDSGSFLISQRSGYGFNTSAASTYAKTKYTINLKEVYEFAVRQNGNIVSVYLNGVLMVQAINDAFATGYNSVEINNYRIGASIDNLVIAYPDYNVREAEGSAVAKFTFDENTDYVNGFWNFKLGIGGTGYSIASESPAAAVSVDSVEASGGEATVGISLANCVGYSAFELRVAYPSDFSVVSATAANTLNGTSAVSATAKNPLVMTFAANPGTYITDEDVLTVVFKTPAASGNYTVTATVIPYVDDVLCASVTGRGTVTVPAAGMSVGLPDGLAYDGETLSWNAPDAAIGYDIYMIYAGDNYETYVDYTEECEYYFPYRDYFPDAGVYTFWVYMYDDSLDYASVSENFLVIVEEDGSAYGGLPAYAAELYSRLEEYVASNTYSSENQVIVDSYLLDAEYYITAETDYDSMISVYEDYKAAIEEVPTGVTETGPLGDVNGDGNVSNSDYISLNLMLRGGSVNIEGSADVNKDGTINNSDILTLNKILRGVGA